ncbi:MAG TPA: outer membrane lipoprotein carrier protein LolA [Phycisphaerae bacterium]|nr:outer membrane lipoprotein carrier protein LolA [Phycisphaerae bacterium]
MKLRWISVLVMGVAAAAMGQAAPGGGDTSAPPEAMGVLKTLQDRAGTLKDFTAKVESDTTHLAGDVDTQTGDAVFVNDAGAGGGAGGGAGSEFKFAAHFTNATSDGKAAPTPDLEIVFDGTRMTMIDRKAKTYRSSTLTSPGGGAGTGSGVTSLGGPMPLPIGLDPAAVVKDFQVTMGEAPDGDHVVLKLKPRDKTKFDYKSLTMTVDKKLQLPVEVDVDQKGGEETAIKLTDVKVNGGGVTIPEVTPPKEAGWTVEEK